MHDPVPHLDYEAFARDLDALRATVTPDEEDARHLRKMALWGRACAALGYATGWVAPNPVSAALISLGSTARWTIIAHHVTHGALDRVEGVQDSMTRRGFAKGWRRLVDWPEWIDPAAWDLEHNRIHHAHTGETLDPDLVEDNTRDIREAKIPRVFKQVAVGFFMATWKLSYYAPNTLTIQLRDELRRAEGEKPDLEHLTRDVKIFALWSPLTADGRAFWRRCVLPYGLTRFAVVPALFVPLGPWASFSVWANSLIAEGITNVHTFAVIAPNHTGDDLYRFDAPPSDRAEYYLRQVLGSVNYRTGGDLNDFAHGFLNYQIEHHLWPDLPPRRYQQLAPKVKAVCEKHGVPYRQESVFARVKKCVAVMLGDASMKPARTRAKGERARATAPAATVSDAAE